MAVTIQQEPLTWSTSDNPLLYVFSSDETGQPNFSFKVEVKIDGQVIFTDKIFPEVGDYAHFDASSVAQYKVTSPSQSDTLFQEAGLRRTIQLVVTENYGTPPADQANASSTITNIWKSKVDDRTFTTIDFDTDYTGQKWLTDHPTNDQFILRDHDVLLSMIFGGVSGDLNMNFYDSNDVLLHNYTTNQFFQIWQLNVRSDLLTSVAGVPDISIVSYFTVNISGSDLMTYRYLDDYCNNPSAVLWINRFGSFDYFIFEHSTLFNGSTTPNGYQRQFGGWNGTTYEYNLNDSGRADYFKNNMQKGTITTDWITQEIQNWWTSIIETGLAHKLYLTDGTNYPIRVTRNSWKKNTQRFDETFQETIQFEVSFSDTSPVL